MAGVNFYELDRNTRLQYRNPPPVPVPRSQYAHNAHAASDRPNPNDTGPKYFSSPFRAPLNRQDRENSQVEHQRSITREHDVENRYPQPRYPQESERTSYTMFEPHPAVSPLRIVKRSHQTSTEADTSDGGSQSSQDPAGVVRQASIGHKAKPSLTDVKRSDSTRTNKQYAASRTPPRRTTADSEVLNSNTAAVTTNLPPPSEARLRPESPTSTYSQDVQRSHRLSSRPSNRTVNTGKGSTLPGIPYSPAMHEYEQLSPYAGPPATSEKSSPTTDHLLGLGIDHQGMSKRVPEDKRPARLDMKAVDELEFRGSVTSLPDLIRRATRLAANLDRGKTASRLGILDMFSNNDHGRKESTLTDVLDAFPDPTGSTPSKTPRPKTMWPGDTKNAVIVSEQRVSRSRRAPRKCCGLSVKSFIVVLVLLIVLIAAAIIIPIFLIVIPGQKTPSTTDLKICESSHLCQNNGIGIVDNNTCSCICVDGFTGSDCSQSSDPNCVTTDIVNKSQTYHNVTIGTSVRSLILDTENQMNLSTNTTVLLSVFSGNNLTCASENSLVDFDLSKRPRLKRFVIVPGLEPLLRGVPNLPVPSRTLQNSPNSALAAVVPRATDGFARRSAYDGTSAATTTIAQSLTIALSTTISADASQTTTATIATDQIRFAQQVVLYILADTRAPSAAVLAQQKIQQYFRAGGLASGNSTVDLGQWNGADITANFAKLALE